MLPHELTPTSLTAIRERKSQAAREKTCAEQRFLRHQERLKARKSRNRSLLAMAITCLGITSLAFAINKPENGAQPGPIRAKSELSSKEIKALNVISAKPEKTKH